MRELIHILFGSKRVDGLSICFYKIRSLVKDKFPVFFDGVNRFPIPINSDLIHLTKRYFFIRYPYRWINR